MINPKISPQITNRNFMPNRKLVLTFTFLAFLSHGYAQNLQAPMVLWYKQPANQPNQLPYYVKDKALQDSIKKGLVRATDPFNPNSSKGWGEALPIGNGRMGAMVFGGVVNERFQLNEESLWAGFNRDTNNPLAAAALPVVRRLIFEGKEDSAKLVAEPTMLGVPRRVRPYQSMGDMWIEFPGADKKRFSNYYRDLDVDRSLASVRYQQDGVNYTRETFASHIDDIILMRLTASKKGSISMNISLHRERDAISLVQNKIVILRGHLKVPDDKGVNRGMTFATQVFPVAKGGKISVEGNKLVISKADEVVIYLSQATSYGGKDPEKYCATAISAASKMPYGVLKSRHISDYQSLYGRVKLNINNISAQKALENSTDKRVAMASASDKGDDYLTSLQYQYSRYLMISSSRPGDLPANLQGLWNQHMLPAWESDYHANVNLQMNYWFVEQANLAECHKPLITYMDSIAKHGQRTAKMHYNANGWVLHHASDIFGYTAPVSSVVGIWPVGGAWLSRHAYEHYLYSGDKNFLRNQAYPQLKGSTEFMLDFLIEMPKGLPFEGKLGTNPSHSPENAYESKKGIQTQFTYSATMDIMIIKDLFDNYLEALNVIQKDQPNFDKDLQAKVIKARDNLIPIQISPSGRIQEWIEDYKETEAGHRHISHVYSLYPDNHISLSSTPQLASAALKTLETRLRGDTDPAKADFPAFNSYKNGQGGTGWARAWMSLCYARLGLGEKAYEHQKYLQSGFAFPNLFGVAHGTFQIDNVFGKSAGINEMLLQSQEGFINLLPAIPAKWKDGFVNGLRAIGGFEVSMKWQDSELKSAKVKSNNGGLCKIKSRQGISKIISGNEVINMQKGADGIMSFATIAGREYRFVFAESAN
jgi:alpha-L-fucosidase 2